MRDKEDRLEPEELEFLEKLGTSVAEQQALHADCPAPEMLIAAQSGVLPEGTNRSIKQHMQKCALCRVLVQDLLDEEIAVAKPEEEARIRAHVFSVAAASPKAKNATIGAFWLFTRRAAPIVSLAAVVLAVLWLGIRPKTPRSAANPVAVEAPPPPAPSVFQLEKLPVKLEAGGVLVWRGAPRNKREKYATELGEALGFYNNEDFREAARRLSVLAAKYPRRPEAHLYLGICRLYLQKNAEAVQSLKRAGETARGPLADDAAWYLALAYERGGQKPMVVAELRKLCGGKSNYADRACAGIGELQSAQGASSQR